MSEPIGRTRWAIAEGYIPSESTGPAPAMTSHETAGMLNAGDRDASVRITVFFAEAEEADENADTTALEDQVDQLEAQKAPIKEQFTQVKAQEKSARDANQAARGQGKPTR